MTTDTQLLAALNAWYAIQHPHTVAADSLDPYSEAPITAMRAALDAANLDATRLRDGIKALLPRLRNLRDTVENLETYDGEDAAEDINTFCTFFTLLVQGEDVAKMFADMDALLDGEGKS